MHGVRLLPSARDPETDSDKRLELKQSINAAFDAVASTFEGHRPWPREAPEAIRAAIWSAAGLSAPALVLDIGAGTGRIGKAFVAAGDSYYGVDMSLAMLQQFSTSSTNCILTQANARNLPFADGFFDVVLFMQVLSGMKGWREALSEARRVLRPGGIAAVGRTVSPESGIDARLKGQLRDILAEMKLNSVPPEQSRHKALAWLESSAVRHVHSVAVSWSVEVTAEDFLRRHRTGARFAALPPDVQDLALAKLRAWAETNFGALDAGYPETRSFELDIFEF